MTETAVNTDFINKFSKTVVNRVKDDIPDLTGKVLDGFLAERKLDVTSGEAELYLCSRISPDLSSGSDSREGEPDSGVSSGTGSFVLKLFRREDALKPEVLEKIRSIRSPCVAPIIHSSLYENHRYVVLPYYRYPSLAEVLAGGETFSREDLRELVIPCVNEGLRAVHGQGVLHKDLKPSNLMLDNTGEHVVLIDFGISTDAADRTFVVTETGMTPFYAAPEALQGVWHRESDYYAFGITLFELYTGHLPFQEDGVPSEDAALITSVKGLEFPEGFPEDLRKLILGLTYNDISRRNEKDNPNCRWGYDEVRRWLSGEELPVPGEVSSGDCPGKFLPYTMGGRRYEDENELLRELLKNPDLGLRELGRGLLTRHYDYFDAGKAALCREAEAEIGDDRFKNLATFMKLVYRLFPEKCYAVWIGEERFENLREFAEGVFRMIAGSVVSGRIALADRFLSCGFTVWYAREILEQEALAGLLETAGKLAGAKKLTGVFRVLLYLTLLSPSCRKIVCAGRVFENERDFGVSVVEAVNAVGGRGGFVSAALECLMSGYLEVFTGLVYPREPERTIAIRSIVKTLCEAPFRDVPESWQGYCLGYRLSGEIRFSIKNMKFSGTEDFFSQVFRLADTDPDSYGTLVSGNSPAGRGRPVLSASLPLREIPRRPDASGYSLLEGRRCGETPESYSGASQDGLFICHPGQPGTSGRPSCYRQTREHRNGGDCNLSRGKTFVSFPGTRCG